MSSIRYFLQVGKPLAYNSSLYQKVEKMDRGVLEQTSILRSDINGSLSYKAYYQLIKELLMEGKTTSQNDNQNYVRHAKLNFQRMKRVYRTTLINDDLKEKLESLEKSQIWLVLSEGWCGDAAQNLPAIARIAELSDKIDLRILLRDKNLHIMDAYLTNGSRSIPKIIALDEESFEEIFTWGPRPSVLQKMVMSQKENPLMSNEEFNEYLHKQYTLDKTQSLQQEFTQLIRKA